MRKHFGFMIFLMTLFIAISSFSEDGHDKNINKKEHSANKVDDDHDEGAGHGKHDDLDEGAGHGKHGDLDEGDEHGKHDDLDEGDEHGKHDDLDEGAEQGKHDDHDEGAEHGKDDDHDEDAGHGEGDEHAEADEHDDHEERGSSSFGLGKAILEVAKEGDRFKLSNESEEFLKIKTKTLKDSGNGAFQIPKNSLVTYQNKKGVYTKRDGWFEIKHITILETHESYLVVRIKSYESEKMVATSGLGFLRAAHLQATGQGGKGHAH